MIERGGGSGEFDLSLFSLISSYNLLQTGSVNNGQRPDHVPMSTWSAKSDPDKTLEVFQQSKVASKH